MFKFFDTIISFASTIVDYVVKFFEGVASMIANFFKAIAFVYQVMKVLPPFLLPVVGVLLACCVIRFILKKGAPDA